MMISHKIGLFQCDDMSILPEYHQTHTIIYHSDTKIDDIYLEGYTCCRRVHS